MVPQVGQGALAVECRHDDRPVRDRLGKIEASLDRSFVELERAFLATSAAAATGRSAPTPTSTTRASSSCTRSWPARPACGTTGATGPPPITVG